MNDAMSAGVRPDGPDGATGDGGRSASMAFAVPLALWGALVGENRRRRGMSQGALGEAAGVSQQSVSKVEAGVICAHDQVKVRLAAALEVPTADLFPWPAPRVSRAPERDRTGR